MLLVVVLLAAAFCLVNGVHDAGNAVAAPVVTHAVRPEPAVAFAAVFHVLGALVVGTAVAATIAGIAKVPPDQMLAVLAAAVLGALLWSLATLWWGLPCSSGHCLVGALAGAALADGGAGAVNWGGLNGLHPVGVLGSLAWLLLSTVLALVLAAVGIRERGGPYGAPPAGSRLRCVPESSSPQRAWPSPTDRTTRRRRWGWSRRHWSQHAG